MKPREAIHQALYLALVEIRAEAYTAENNKIFHLADLFHNIPLQLERVSQDEESYDDVLEWLRKRASEKGFLQWLDQAIE
ncbi:MAG TPA: hypothetical protein VGB76_03155 [Pyrinomonadaceae bacterium]|jgi:hypothetical protein